MHLAHRQPHIVSSAPALSVVVRADGNNVVAFAGALATTRYVKVRLGLTHITAVLVRNEQENELLVRRQWVRVAQAALAARNASCWRSLPCRASSTSTRR